MTDSDELIPSFRWRLSAAESQILLWGPETGDAWALKIALLELLVRRVFVLSIIEQKRFLRSAHKVTVVAQSKALDANAARELQTIVTLYLELRSKSSTASGTPIDLLARAVFSHRMQRVRKGLFRRGWDRTGSGYVQSDILPELQRMGLLKSEQTLRLAIIPSTRCWLTPEGDKILAELTRFMEIGRNSLREWVMTRPDLARRYLEQAGPSVLLLGGIAETLSEMRDPSSRVSAATSKDPFSVESLTARFGPSQGYDLDFAFHTLSIEVDRGWDEMHRSGGGIFFWGE